MSRNSIYGGRDPRRLPAYGVAEAARYLRIPAATLRSWVAGRTYPLQDGVGEFAPLIRAADPEARKLSFENLVEAHVLRALRTKHGLPVRAVRPALEYAERELGIERLLLNNEPLLTDGGELFLDRFGELVSLSRSGQIAIRAALQEHLRRVERDDAHIPIRLYPFGPAEVSAGRRNIVIDPRLSFGRPTIARVGVRTEVVASRVNAGESIDDLALDYGITPQEVEDAILFHQAAA
jgi:uncharacterized protein (DUF433 family)